MQPGQVLPSLWFRDLGGYDGMFRHSSKETIEINSLAASKFEGAHLQADAQDFLIAKILHEMVHWARFPNEPRDIEAGEAFEKSAFGKVLPRFWDPAATTRAHMAAETLTAHQPAVSHLQPQDFGNGDLTADMPRGIRNNNPGNIKRSGGDQWKGLADSDEMTPFQKREMTFCVFTEPRWGLRALARTLRNYQRLHNLRTTLQMVSRWAPGSDNNDTRGYAEAVASYLSIDMHDAIDFDGNTNLALQMMHAFIRQENTIQPYSKTQLREGYELSA